MELPRRAFLGLAIRDDRGILVTRVVPGSMGERAALASGDRIEALDGVAVANGEALMRELRAAAGRAEVTLRYRREALHEVIVPVVPMPGEAGARYGHVTSNGARLRTITIEGGSPSILFLQGIRCQSIDFALQPDAPIAKLMRGLAERGITSIRVDRPGMGDSEGGPCESIDFDAEVETYAAVMRELRPRYLFGHSVGGVVAPILASRFDVAGIVAYGTSAERWSAALRQGFARQWALRGNTDVDARLARFDADPFEDRHGRSLAFHEGIQRNDAESAWRSTSAPALIVIGEHDWVVGEEAQRAIPARHKEIVVLDGLDHAFTRHASLEDSLRDYGAGAFDERLIDETARFVLAQR